MTARDRLTEAQLRACDLQRHIAVTAGAGSGKTRVLTERYVRAIERVRARPHPLRRVVALTFTEKATMEMRGRVREMVTQRLRDAARAGDRDRVAQWREIRSNLLAARISTLHAFCAQLLRDHALEAAIDPDFEIVDAAEADLLAVDATRRYLGRVARRDPETDKEAAALRRLLTRYRPGELRPLLETLIEERAVAEEWFEAETPGLAFRADETQRDLERRVLTAGLAIRRLAGRTCLEAIIAAAALNRDDPLGAVLREVARLAEAALEKRVTPEILEAARPALLTADGKARGFGRVGGKRTWAGAIGPLRETLNTLATAVAEEAGGFAPVDPEIEATSLEMERDLRTLYGGLRTAYAELLGAGRRTDFAGLELAALALLDEPRVAARVRAEIDFLLIDEFQDTNRLQWTILERILGDGIDAGTPNLFIVGDDKQAIYEFRGGRVEIFRRAQRWIVARGGETIPLDENFRSLPAPIGFVNALFARVFDAGADREFEPEAQPLVSQRGREEPGRPGGVELLLGPSHEEMPRARDAEASRIAEHLNDLVASRTTIRDPASDQTRPAGWSDIAVITFYRRLLPHLEAALAARRVPFTVFGGHGFYQTVEVMDIRTWLRALTDARDEIALAAVLRSPFFSFPDDLLWRIARAPGESFGEKFHHAPGDPASPAAATARRDAELLGWSRSRLFTWREAAGRIPTASLLAAAMDESGYRAVTTASPNGTRRAANLEKLLELVHRFEATHGIDPARLSAWFEAQSRRAGEESEAPDPEAPEGVTLMTIHAAKGTEFPIVVVAGLCEASRPRRQTPMTLFGDDRGARLGLRIPDGERDRLIETARFRLIEAERRERERAEQKRVLYVAMTRARDRLVLSTRAPGNPTSRSVRRAPHVWLERHEAMANALSRPAAAATLEVEGIPVSWIFSEDRQLPPLQPDLRLPDAVAQALGQDPAPVSALTPGSSPEAGPSTDLPARATHTVTALTELAVCPRHYFYHTVMGLPQSHPLEGWRESMPEEDWSARDPARSGGGMDDGQPLGRGREIGTRVHDALARLRTPEDAEALLVSLDPAIRPHVLTFLASERAREVLSAGGGLTEIPFTLVTPGGRIDGTVDRLYRAPDGVWTVLDYKTNRLPADSDAAGVCLGHAYDVQLMLYAVAAARLKSLVPNGRVRTVLFFTSSGDEIVRDETVHTLPAPRELGAMLTALGEHARRGREQSFPRRVTRKGPDGRDLLAWAAVPDAEQEGPHCQDCPYRVGPCTIKPRP